MTNRGPSVPAGAAAVGRATYSVGMRLSRRGLGLIVAVATLAAAFSLVLAYQTVRNSGKTPDVLSLAILNASFWFGWAALALPLAAVVVVEMGGDLARDFLDPRPQCGDQSAGQVLVREIDLGLGLGAARLDQRPANSPGGGLAVAEDDVQLTDAAVDVVITTGGTGLTGRDLTPEALHRIDGKDIPGFGELFRWISFQKIGTSTIQSRATACVACARLAIGWDSMFD